MIEQIIVLPHTKKTRARAHPLMQHRACMSEPRVWEHLSSEQRCSARQCFLSFCWLLH